MFNPRAWKKKQQRYFDELAEEYDRGFSPLLLALHLKLLDESGIKPGMRVLNIGCGTGTDSLLAADIVGESGSVVGIDISPEMVRIAREKVAARRLDTCTFEVMDAEKLAFDDGSFDAVVCQWALMYFPEDQKALSEAYRVLRPGGRAAFGVIGRSENSPFVMVPFRIVTQHLPTIFVSEGGPPQFRWGPEGAIEASMTSAGFVAAWSGRYATMITMRDADLYWDLFRSTVAAFSYRFSRERPETQEPLIAEIKETVERHATADGIRLQLEWVLGVGYKPVEAVGAGSKAPVGWSALTSAAQTAVPRASDAAVVVARDAGALIDVRQPEEVASGPLAGARNIPRGAVEEVMARELGDVRLPVVCCCDTGERAALAAQALRGLGYERATWARVDEVAAQAEVAA